MAGYDLVVTTQRRTGDFWSLTQSQITAGIGHLR